MEIRKAAPSDIPRIMEIYRAAQEFMIKSGNPGQWGRSYPTEEDYGVIDGAWLNDEEYVAIHRIANDGALHGVVAFVTDFCKEKYRNIRVDTHEKNLPMQRALERSGFVRCGTVWVRDKSPRIAFHLKTEKTTY